MFSQFLTDSVSADKGIDIYFTHKESHSRFFAYLEWEQEDITYEYVKEVWEKFDQSWGDIKIVRKEYQLQDGSSVICPTDKFLSVSISYCTDMQTILWQNAVNEVLGNLPLNVPLSVEFNPIDHVRIERHVPTVILDGYSVWCNNGTGATNNDFYPIVFRNVATLAYFPNYVNDAKNLDFCKDEPDECIITPFCVIRRNTKGFGNTVFLRTIKFNDDETPGCKNIHEVLKEDFFWTKVLIPLTTLDFSALRAEFEKQEIPMLLQAKNFKIKSENALRAEIADLKLSKESAQVSINTGIKEITRQKLLLRRLDEIIKEKTNALEKRLHARQLINGIKSLTSLPYVEKVSFNGLSIEIVTKPIQIDDGPFLGGYTIIYNTNTKSLEVNNDVNPITHGRSVLSHPHIAQNGDVCLGNYSDIFLMFEVGEYCVGMELLHKFLSTYNPDDEWGRRLIWWDAEYVFEDMRTRGMLDCIEPEYNDYYYDIYGKHLPSTNICPECQESNNNCMCYRCEYCRNHIDDCVCWICPDCNCRIGFDCECERCESCSDLLDDCECARCDVCEKLLDPQDEFHIHCTCERCPADYNVFIDTDEFGCCTECEIWGCGYNCNKSRPAHQDETLF